MKVYLVSEWDSNGYRFEPMYIFSSSERANDYVQKCIQKCKDNNTYDGKSEEDYNIEDFEVDELKKEIEK